MIVLIANDSLNCNRLIIYADILLRVNNTKNIGMFCIFKYYITTPPIDTYSLIVLD